MNRQEKLFCDYVRNFIMRTPKYIDDIYVPYNNLSNEYINLFLNLYFVKEEQDLLLRLNRQNFNKVLEILEQLNGRE